MGEMEDADALGEAEDPILKDLIFVYIKVKEDIISDISFQTFGCATAIASSSMLTELVKGKTLNAVMKITQNDLADAFNGIPKKKMHSCNLAIRGLRAAIKNYSKK